MIGRHRKRPPLEVRGCILATLTTACPPIKMAVNTHLHGLVPKRCQPVPWMLDVGESSPTEHAGLARSHTVELWSAAVAAPICRSTFPAKGASCALGGSMVQVRKQPSLERFRCLDIRSSGDCALGEQQTRVRHYRL